MKNLQTKKIKRKKTIYWDELRKGYNNEFNTSYDTIKSFISLAYARHKTIEKTSEILGISRYAFWRKLQALNIPRLQKGHRGACKCLQTLWKLDDISNLSLVKIVKQTGFTRSYILFVMKRNNIVWKKEKGVNPETYSRIKPQTPKKKPEPFIFGHPNPWLTRANEPTS